MHLVGQGIVIEVE